jgi:FkbM family methyltransferase
VRDQVRAVLDRAGLEVRRRGGGGFRSTLGEVLGDLRERGVAPATLVDVGVAHGTPDLYGAFPDARLLLVEPLAEYEGTLRAICAERDGRWTIAAAGPQAGSTTLHVHRAPVLSSTSGGARDDGGATTARKVPVVRLDDLVEEHALPGPYLLKVDVEGAELDVVAGAPRLLEQADAVVLEAALFRLVGTNPELADVIGAMRERGFVPYDLFAADRRPLDGALAKLDVCFVPEGSPLRASHAYARPDQADALYRRWGF